MTAVGIQDSNGWPRWVIQSYYTKTLGLQPLPWAQGAPGDYTVSQFAWRKTLREKRGATVQTAHQPAAEPAAEPAEEPPQDFFLVDPESQHKKLLVSWLPTSQSLKLM